MSGFPVAILTNGSARVGLGHLRRCLTLAHALVDGYAARVLFIVNQELEAVEFIRAQGFQTVMAGLPWDSCQVEPIVKATAGMLLVTDSYDVDANFLSSIRPSVRSLFAIDDTASQPLPVDVVVNSAADAGADAYASLTDARLLIGPGYALLRKEFSDEPHRRFGDSINRVFMNTGGSDPFDLTPRLIEWTRESLPQAKLDVVVGPFFANASKLASRAAREAEAIAIHVVPENIRQLMLRSDLAITAGGQTTYELAATATPALAICVAENQKVNVIGLEREGTLLNAGRPDDPQFENRMHRLLMQLDRGARERMAEQGRRVVDGRGAERVAAIIAEYAA